MYTHRRVNIGYIQICSTPCRSIISWKISPPVLPMNLDLGTLSVCAISSSIALYIRFIHDSSPGVDKWLDVASIGAVKARARLYATITVMCCTCGQLEICNMMQQVTTHTGTVAEVVWVLTPGVSFRAVPTGAAAKELTKPLARHDLRACPTTLTEGAERSMMR